MSMMLSKSIKYSLITLFICGSFSALNADSNNSELEFFDFPKEESSESKKEELANNLFQAYQLADCKSEANFYKAYQDIYNRVSNRTLAGSAMMMADVEECNRVSACDFDGSQFNNGEDYCGAASTLRLGATGDGGMHVGVIANGWMIPPGSTITSATIQFTAAENSTGPAAFTVYGDNQDNPSAYSTANDILSRIKTAANVNWSPGTWTAGDAGTAQVTPDLTSIVQEIVNRPGYAMGNNVGFIISGKGRRTAESFDTNAGSAPEICITYDVPDPPSSTCSGCPNISVVSLDGVPNYPTVDLLNLCSSPDTASILIYNAAACKIHDVEVSIAFDEGLSYGGFVFKDPSSTGVGTVMASDLSDLVNPSFIISEIDSAAVFIINIAIQADCDVDTDSEEDINFDAEVTFLYNDDNGTTPSCTEVITEVGAYNSGVRVPVLNVLTVTPPELNISQSNTPECQRVLISQDGIQAFLDEFQFEIGGVDQSVYMVTSIDISDVVVPPSDYTYDAASQTISLTVADTYFTNDTGSNNVDGDLLFETGESVFVDVCYQVIGCTDEANFLMYQAFYGCNDKICGDISEMQGAVNFTPNFGANAVAVSANVQYGGICGDNLTYDLIVQSSNSDPLNGLWEDVSFKYKGCIISNTSVVDLRINGASIPAGLWTATAGTVSIDLATNTTDFDGPGGIEALDGDGIYNDVPGGNVITISTELEIGCAMEGADCSAISCTLTQLEVNGKRNCGQTFQQFATIGGEGPINFVYGATSTSWTSDPDWPNSIRVTDDFTTVCDTWLPTTNGYDFSYDFANENILPCAGSNNIELVINVVANGDRITDTRYTDGSATYQGVPVPAGDVTYEYLTTGTLGIDLDTFAMEIRIRAGDALATTNDYTWNIDYRGDCYPDDYVYLSYKVVETCTSCNTTDPCEIVRACDNANTYIRWRGCGCVCDIYAFIDTIQRVNYGYADKAMTQKLTAADVPAEDRQRFVPGDTMYYRAGFEILNAEVFYTADYVWNFYVDPREDSGPIMPDVNNSTFGGWFYEDGATGVVTEIGIPDCFQNYPDATRDYYYEPSIELRNFGVEGNSTAWANRNDDAYQTCINDDNVNPNYPPESAINYRMADDSSDDRLTDRQRIWIRFGRPQECSNNITNSETDGQADDGADSPCHAAFLQQFPLKDGDIIYFDVISPVVHNPAFELNQLNSTGFSTATFLRPHADVFNIEPTSCANGSAGVASLISSSCDTSTPYEGHLPGPVSVVPDVVVTDCDIEVEYTFTLQNAVPMVDIAGGEVPWYANEYKPYMATEYLELRFPTNMVYLNDGTIINPDGSEIALPAQYIDDSYGNLACIGSGLDVCCTAADTNSLAAMRIVDADFNRASNILSASEAELLALPGTSTDLCDSKSFVHQAGDPFPMIPIGGADPCLTYGLRYHLSALCPEEVESTDFEMAYQFAEPYIPNLVGRDGGVYRGSFADGNGNEYVNSYRNAFVINPYGTRCGEQGVDDGCIAFYDRIFPHPVGSTGANNPMRQTGTQTTNPDQFEDNSQDFPPLIPMLENLLKADLAGINETNTYTVCAGTVGGTATHTNVVTSIEVPNAVEFIDVQDDMGNSLTWTLAQTLADSKVYAVVMNDLAPGECQEITIVTELLFCPVGLDIATEICVSTVSGCLDPAKAAALSAAGGACDLVSACYEYVAEEADIQVEWLLPDPAGSDEYGLCEEIPMSVRIKNVKPSVLTAITQDFWFPAGLTPVSGSWEVCYPGGPTFTAPCVSIPVGDEPVPVAGENNVFGLNYSWDEDANWSDYIDQNGLPGILNSMDQPIELDSNQVSFNFLVETSCDEFVSGTGVYYQAFGADPCESTVSSMFVDSEPIIIENANPVDFAQFFVFAEPATANCGEDATLVLTYLNVSPLGESRESTVCIDLETETFDYMSGSVQWVSPSTHNPTISEEMNGPITHVCFDIPDGIGPGEAFQISLDYSIPEDINCGEQDLGVSVTSEIMDQSCMALGVECSVYVLNTVNPQIQVEFLPPLNVDDQLLMTKCPNVDGTVDLCYDITLSNPGAFYSGDVTVKLIRDVNLNGLIDDPVIDTELADMDHLVLVNTGETFEISGCFTVDEAQACPVFLMITQTTDCVCDNLDYYYDSIEPAINDDMQTEYTLCPGVPFGVANCGSWTYTVTPSNGASIANNAANDSLYITLNAGFGVGTPVILTVSSQTGGCQSFDFPIELYSLSDFEFGPFAELQACNVGCQELSLNIPSNYESSVTVEWLPNQYLDDNTSLTPTICNPEVDVNYFVRLTFETDEGSCEYTANYPVVVQQQVVEEVIENGNLCSTDQATFEAPTGYSTYMWIRVNADGTETTVANGPESTYTATEEALFYVTYQNLGAVCAIRSNTFSVYACPEMEKSLADIVPTGNPNEYTVIYTIEVTNPGTLPTVYDIYDEPGFDTDIVASTASFTTDAAGVSNGGLSLPAPTAPGWILGDDVSIDGGATHTYTVQYIVTIDLEDGAVGDDTYTACGQGSGPANAVPGEGLYNNASLDLDNDPTTPEVEDNDCGELPYLTLDKEHESTVATSANCYDVTYSVKVSNIGGAEGQYDLVDDPDFDDDFVITSSIFTTDAIGNPGGSLPITSSTYVLADNQTISAGKVDSFAITINVCIDLEDAASVGDETYVACGAATPGDPTNGEGLFNEATLDVNNDGTPDITDDVCVDVPYLILTKTAVSADRQADGSFDIVYELTVENIGGVAAPYDLNDYPQYDDDIVINTASFTSDVPSMGTLPAVVPASPGWVVATAQSIAPGELHTYTVNVNVSMDLSDAVGDNSYTECGEGGGPNGMPGEGVYNEASLDTNGDDIIDDTAETCTDIKVVDVALTKVVATPGPYSYGDVVDFDIEIFNQGNVVLTDVLVTDYISCGYVYSGGSQVWNASGDNYQTTVAGPIAPNGSVIVTISLEVVACTSATENAYLNVAEVTSMSDADGVDVTGEDVDSTGDDIEDNDGGGSVDTDSDNVVDGNGTGTNGDTDPATDEDDQDPAQIEVFDLALTKTLADAGPYNWMDDITFDINLTNQGNVMADNILVTDYLPSCFILNDAAWTDNGDDTAEILLSVANGGLTAPLAPGESITVPMTVTVGLCQGEIQTNYAEISAATDENGDPVTDVDSTPDDTNGNDAGGNPDGNSDDVIDGEGTGTPGDDNPSTDEDDHDPEQVQVQVYADLALIKTLGTTQENPVMAGDAVQFQIQVLNQGPIPTDNIEVTDYIPACLTLNDPTWVDNGANATRMLSVANGELSGPLMPGNSIFITIDFTVNACPNGVIENWAEISEFTGPNGEPLDDIDSTPDDNQGNDTYTDNNDVTGDGNNGGDEDDHDPEQIVLIDTEEDVFDLALIKTLAPGQPATIGSGDIVVFQIEVINQGTYSVDNVNVVDYIPSCMTLEDADWTSTGANSAEILLSVANGGLTTALAPGQSVFVTIDLRAASCSGIVTNWAEIESSTDDDGNVWTDVDSTPDNTQGNDTYTSDDDTSGNGNTGGDEDDHDPASVIVVPETPGDFDLALIKTLSPGQANPIAPGASITFDIDVMNQGDIAADNIVVTDYMPACLLLADTDWTDNGDGTADITLSVANGGLESPLLPGTTVTVPITLQENGCGNTTQTNWAEISEATDGNGDPVTDIDSTPDADQGNDEYGLDDQTNGDGTDDEDDHDPEQITISDGVVEEFDLALIKILSPGQTQAVEQGDLVSFDIQVTNQGNVSADNIEVIDYTPTCLELMDADWTDNGNSTASITLSVANGFLSAPLAPNQSIIVSITMEVLACNETSTTNWAEISGATDGNGDPVTDVDSTPDDMQGNDPYANDNDNTGDGTVDEDDHDPEMILIMPPTPEYDLALLKTLSLGQPNPVAIGDDVSFDIQVTNQGDESVDNISIIDYLPACLTLNDAAWTDNGDGTASIDLSVANGGLVAPLAPGQSIVTPIVVTVEACAVGINTNWAEISSFTDEDGDPQDDVDSTPDSDPDNDNFGGDDEILEDGTQGGDEDDHDPEDITVIDPSNNTFDLALTKTLAPGQASSVGQGATVTFNVNVINQGTIAADNITVIDYIPSCAMLADPAWTDNGDGSASKVLSVANGGLTTVLQPGMTVTVPVTIVLTDCTGGDIINYAEIADATDENGDPVDDIDSTPDSDPDNDEEGDNDQEDGDGTDDEDDHDPEVITVDPTIPMDFDLALIKKLSPGQSGTVKNGDMINFTITVFNQGDLSADNISVTDYMPSCMTLADSDWTDNGDGTAVTVLSVANGALATPLLPNTSTQVQITLLVNNCTNGTVTNWAEISGATDGAGNPQTDVDSTPDSDPDNDEFMTDNDPSGDGTMDEDDHDPEEVLIDNDAVDGGDFDLALVKVLQPTQSSTVMTGDIVDYDIYVINQGDISADNVEITEYIPSCFTLADNNWTDNGDGTATILLSVANGGLATPILPRESVSVPVSLKVGSCNGTTQTNWAEISDATDGNGDPVTDVDSTPDDDQGNDVYGDDDATDGNGTDDEDDHDPESVDVVDELDNVFDLALTKTLPAGAPSMLPLNSQVVFNVNVFNQGNIAADNIEVVDYLPACATLVPGGDWTDNGDGTATVILSVANGGLDQALASGQSVTVPITLDLGSCQAGTITNWAEIADATDEDGNEVTDTDSTPDDDQGNDTYGDDNDTNGDGTDDEDDHDPESIVISPILDQEFDLALIKTLAPGQTSMVSNGDVVVFEITVYNQGNVPADNIQVIDYLPTCMTLNDPNWFYDVAANEAVRILSVANGMLAAPLAPGQNVMVPITTVINGCGNGPIVNYAEIESVTDANGDPVTDIDSTPDDDNTNDTFTNDNDPNGDGKNGGDEDDSDPEILQVGDNPGTDVFDLALIKIVAPGQINIVEEGDNLTFQIQVTNQGDIPADNITVVDYLPSCASLDDTDWTDNGDGTASITLSVANGGLTTPITPGQSVLIPITTMIGECVAGDHYNWAEISDATDALGNPQTDVDSTPDDNPDNDTFITDNNNSGDGKNGGDEDDHDPELFVVEPRFDLALQKVNSNSGPYNYGDNATFDIIVYNQGNVPATNISVVDYMPSGYIFNAADNTGWTLEGDGTLTYLITDVVAPDANVRIPLTLEITPSADQDWINHAEISGATDEDGNDQEDDDSQLDDFPDNDNDVDPGDDDDNVIDEDATEGGDEDDSDPAGIDVFDLAIAKTTEDTGPYHYGDTKLFEFRVYNQGNVTASNVVVNDFIPCGYRYLDSNDSDWTYDAATSIATTTFTGLIEPGAFGYVEIELEIIPCYMNEATAWLNVVEIESSEDDEGNPQDDTDGDFDDDPNNDGDPIDDEVTDPDDEDNHDPEDIDVWDVAQIKQVVTDEPYRYGDVIEYKITVCNQGNRNIQNVSVVDYVPVGFTFDVANQTEAWVATGTDDNVSLLIPDVLIPGACVERNIFLVIEQTDGGDENYTNYTEVTDFDDENGDDQEDADSTDDNDPDNDGDPTDDSITDPDDEDDHDPEFVEVIDIAMKKVEISNGPYKYGDQLNFSHFIYNQGNVGLTNIVLNDFIPCGYDYDTSNDAVWSYDATASVATTTVTSMIEPGDSLEVSITLILKACSEDNAWENISEIESFDDENGDDRTDDDIDSDGDDDPNNDGDVVDDETQNDGGDEDDNDPETVIVYDLALTKVATWMGVDSIGPFIPGDIIEYHIDVYNQGNQTVYNTLITDYLRNGYIFDASNNSGWSVAASGDLEFTIAGPFVPGQVMNLVLNLIVDVPADATADSWYNEAEVTEMTDMDGVPQVDSDSTPDNDPDNDNDLVDGDDDDNIFNGDDNDNVIDEDINDPFNEGDDDEDDNDAAEILVTSEIGDYVWKDLNGDGIQDVGEPGIEGVRAVITRCDGEPMDPWVTDTLYTDANGYYLFDQLLPSLINGAYQIQFDISSLPPGCAFTLPNRGGDDAADSDSDLNGNTTCIELDPGERNHTVDAGVLPLAKLGDTVFLDCDGDGVQDAGEAGIEGIKVEVYNPNGFLVAQTVTDANGKYLVDFLYPGDYYVKFISGDYEFTLPGLGGDSTADSDVDDSNGPGTTALVNLSAGECDITSFDAGLYMCVPLGELVWLDYNENDMWDSFENGINGLKVELYKFLDNSWVLYDYEYTGHKPGTPSDDGYFKFCVAPGRYYLKFNNPPATLVPAVANFGINENTDSDVTGAFGPGTTSEINLVCGQERCDIGAGYYTMGSIGDNVWSDDNENGMRDNGEKGVSDVIVRAYDVTGSQLGEAVTDDRGQYTIDYLGKNSYYLKFELPNGLAVTQANMGNDEAMDSDVDGSNGPMTTDYYTINPGEHVPNIDAGVVLGVLSVEWLDIRAENNDAHHTVTWDVAKESNVSHYEIERSIDGLDNFEVIGKILSEEDSPEKQTYSYNDYDVTESGVYYYRVNQVELGGDTDYSKVVSVDRAGAEVLENKASIYPNPVVDELTLDIEIAKPVTDLVVNIYDAQGRIAKANAIMDIDVEAGSKSYKLDVSDFAKGVYSMKIKLDRREIVKKLIIVE